MKKLITLLLVLTGIVTTANAATETTVYYAVPVHIAGSYNAAVNVNYQGDGNDWHRHAMTKTDKTYMGFYLYSCTFTDAWNGVGVLQFQLYDGDITVDGNQKWNSTVYNSWTSVDTYNNKMFVHGTEGNQKMVSYENDDDRTLLNITYHVKKNNDWTPLNAYQYKGYVNTGWAGDITSVNTLNNNWYDFTVQYPFDIIIFNDGEGGEGHQTDNLTIGEATEYWVTNGTASTDENGVTTTLPADFNYTRSVTVGKFGTICLPYAATITGATVYEITGKIMDGTTFKGINLQSVEGTLTAGKPYIFKATNETLTATLSGTKVDAATTDNNGLIGNLDATIKAPEDSYVLSNNKICRVAAANAVNVGQYKAYINVAGVPEVLAPTMDFIPFEDAEYSTTGISNAVKDAEAEGAIYNLNGQRVTSAQKGLFIINGKKLVIR